MKVPVAISVVAHALLGLALLHPALPRGPASLVAVALFDRAAPTAAVPAPAPKHEVSVRAVERARPRLHRVARALPLPAPPPVQPQPAPVAPPPPAVSEPELPDVDADADEGQAATATDLPAASALPDLRRDPELEPGSCTRGLEYPPSVKQIQQEVVVRLRVALDARGQVRAVQLVQRAGDAFDDTAMKAVRERCRFTAALDEHGRPVAFTIDDYRFHFRPADFQSPLVGHFLLQ